MIDTSTAAAAGTAQHLLATARGQRRTADRAEADLLASVLAWAHMHPAESINDAAVEARLVVDGRERALPVAGPGAPLVAEFCIAELAAALGLRTEQGRDLVGETVELAYRLPRLWARVRAGDLQAWRARRVARSTTRLSRAAAAYVDTHLAPFAHKVGATSVDRLVAEAVARCMPDLAAREATAAADRRHVDIDLRTRGIEGTCVLSGELDLADALDLDAALTAGAHQLQVAGHDRQVRVLRAVALGDLARGHATLPFEPAEVVGPDPRSASGNVATTATDAPTSTAPQTPSAAPTVPPRRVVLHVHLTAAALRGSEAGDVCRLEGTAGQGGRHLVTTDRVREWCATAGSVRVVPVVDTAQRISVEAYEIPDRLAVQVAERDVGCRFPWCSRPASACDYDHLTEFSAGGPTASDNLAPLCRHHHRLKTHGRWRYTMIEPGTYLWRSPHGASYVVDPSGTRAV